MYSTGIACLVELVSLASNALVPAGSVTAGGARQVTAVKLDNRELDKLVGALGRSRATWRRALLLHEWLLGLGHAPDDRLCTTLIRVCAQHGQVRRAVRPFCDEQGFLAASNRAAAPQSTKLCEGARARARAGEARC